MIEIRELSFKYKGGSDYSLKDINLKIKKGECILLCGRSGCGKSTLLHLLAGVDKPTSGDIFIQDKNITKFNKDEMTIFRRRNIGVVYQFFNLIPNINVRKNILLPLLLDNKKADEEYLKEILSILGIEGKLDRYPKQLSGGEQQRVAIARSLITRPAIILADEPTGNLDRKNSEEITGLFRLVNKRLNSTIMIITHDEKVANSCDKVYRMVDGRLNFLGDETYENY